jgi:alkyl hydroperoxide reductase subunit AhpF
MAFLQARDEAAVKKEFERIGGPVKLTVFATELGGDSNTQAVALIREVAALSDQLSVTVLNPHIDRDQAAAYGITESPAVVVEGAQDYGIRFLGIPAGYEFSNLIDSIIAVSTGEAGLTDETKATLAGLTEDVTIKVFATPT